MVARTSIRILKSIHIKQQMCSCLGRYEAAKGDGLGRKEAQHLAARLDGQNIEGILPWMHLHSARTRNGDNRGKREGKQIYF
jgi:hypothetical protein